MKMTPDLQKAQDKMKPGAITRDGFLGDDPRDLATILDEHHAQCHALKVHWRDIAEMMRRVGRAGLAGFGAPIQVGERWEVIADENRGKIPCPWPEPGVYQKTVYTVKNLRIGQAVRYSELSIHLIGKHGFFQGEGAPFHNDPAKLVEVLEIEKSDYQPYVPNMHLDEQEQ